MRKKSLFAGIVIFVLMFTYIFGFSEAVNNTTVKAASEVSMIYENDTLTISGLEAEADLIHASYENGKLSGISIYKAQNGVRNINAKNGDRFFLWESIASMYPLCHAVTVNETEKVNNILITYFSRAGENWEVGYVDKGNTAVIADYIKEKVDADVFEITPVDPYPESYSETLTRVQRERDNNERPEFNGEIENFDQYDTVFLGYPIWYGGLPMIMYTFLEKYDMSGKTVIPFSTHGGSGWGSTLSELSTLCPDAEFADGFSTAGTNARSAQDEVNSWLDELDLSPKEVMTAEDEVLAAFEKIQQAMIDKDMETLNHMTKDDKTFTTERSITTLMI